MKKWIALVLAMVALAPVGAFGQDFSLGASPEAVGSGARALGQGNAFIAVADDATAASWNPGGLAQLEKPEISFALESLRRRSHMDVPDHPESSTIHTVQLEDLNYLSVVYPFQGFGRHMVFSLNYLKQYRLDQDFFTHITQPNLPFPGWQNDDDYSLEQSGNLTALAPALAIDVTPKLSLGVAVNIWNDDVTGASDYRQSIYQRNTLTMPFPPFSASTDNYFLREYSVDDGYSLVLGGLYRVSREWAVGAVIKPAYTLHIEQKGIDISDAGGAGEVVSPDDGARELELPWTVGAGVAWKPNDSFTLATDITWSNWSEYTLKDEDDRYLNPLSLLPSDGDKCRDTVAARLGVEYLLIGGDYVVPLRGGLAYDPAPAVGEVDEWYAATVGIGYQRGRFMADLAYEFRWGRNLTGGGAAGAAGLDATEDSERHRLLMSLIVYL